MPDAPHPDDPQAALVALAHSFGVSPDAVEADTPLRPALTLDDVRAFLVPRITLLLDRSPERLMSILYRVDVDEQAVRQAFATCGPGHLAGRLADLLIERQIQKLHIRRAYQRRTP